MGGDYGDRKGQFHVDSGLDCETEKVGSLVKPNRVCSLTNCIVPVLIYWLWQVYFGYGNIRSSWGEDIQELPVQSLQLFCKSETILT